MGVAYFFTNFGIFHQRHLDEHFRMDSRQLATAKLKRVNFVTNDLLLLKRGSDLGISVHFVDLHSVGGIPSRAALKAAAYNPQPVTAR